MMPSGWLLAQATVMMTPTCPGGHSNPQGSRRLTGSLPANAYRFSPPASPIGSSLVKRASAGSYQPRALIQLAGVEEERTDALVLPQRLLPERRVLVAALYAGIRSEEADHVARGIGGASGWSPVVTTGLQLQGNVASGMCDPVTSCVS